MQHDTEKPEHGFLLRISGRIQGVGFRYWAERTAARLRVTGYVRNESDGTVSCACRGQATAVEAFVKALHRGPPQARVDKVSIQPLPADESFRKFEIRY